MLIRAVSSGDGRLRRVVCEQQTNSFVSWLCQQASEILRSDIASRSTVVFGLVMLVGMGSPAAEDLPPAHKGEFGAPSGLLCELLSGPITPPITDPSPEFSWIVPRSLPGGKQTAYELKVRRVDAAEDADDVWSSGRVESSKSVAVEYSGTPLQNNSEYLWRVRLWGEDAGPTAWSTPQRISTAPAWDKAFTPTLEIKASRRQPEVLVHRKDGSYLIDFGKAAFGYFEVKLSNPMKGKLVTHFGEKLQSGKIDRSPGGTIRYCRTDLLLVGKRYLIEVRPPKDKRNTTQKAVRLPKSMGVVTPFRYIELEGIPQDVEIEECVQMAFTYPFDWSASFFESSDATLNAIWDICKYSIEATTFCGVYVDGDRERIPYEADAYINQLSHYAVDREYAIARRTHDYLMENPTWPTEWKQHSVLIAWDDYLHTGDHESLALHYEQLKREKVLSEFEQSDGLLNTSEIRDIVDWPQGERDSYDFRPVNTVVNAFHYRTLVLMQKIAKVLKRDNDAAMYAKQCHRVRRAFNSAFFAPDRGCYVDGVGSEHVSLHGNLFPLAFGLVDAEHQESVLALIKSRDMACSVYAAQYLLEGLYQAGESQYALDLLTSQEDRSWFNMIREGSTVTLEAWGKKWKPNLDWNHAWGAAPANLIPRFLVGCRPVGPGCSELVVQPQPASLDWFSARCPTIRGFVEVDYKKTSDGYDCSVGLPANVSVFIGLPEIKQPALHGSEASDQGPHQVIHNGTAIELTGEPPKGACDNATLGWIGPLTGGEHKFSVSVPQ